MNMVDSRTISSAGKIPQTRDKRQRLTVGSAYKESPGLFGVFVSFTKSHMERDLKASLGDILSIADVDFALGMEYLQAAFDRGVRPSSLLRR